MSKIHFSEKGIGQTLIFIHGFGEIGAMWEDIAKALSSEFHVFYPDLPGLGKTPITSDEISLEQVAVQLEEWMEENKIENPYIFGHSLGGYVVLAVLELMGSKISGIGLIHSSTFADDEEKKESRNKTITLIKKQGVDKFVTSFVPQLFTATFRDEFQEEIDFTVAQGKQSSLNGLIAFTKAMRDRKSRYEVVKGFSGPKLLIAGTKDEAVKIESVRDQKAAFTDYHELEGVGHMGQIERKNEVIEIIRDFLKN